MTIRRLLFLILHSLLDSLRRLLPLPSQRTRNSWLGEDLEFSHLVSWLFSLVTTLMINLNQHLYNLLDPKSLPVDMRQGYWTHWRCHYLAFMWELPPLAFGLQFWQLCPWLPSPCLLEFQVIALCWPFFFFFFPFLFYFHFCSWWRWLHLCRVCPETLELIDLGGFHRSSVSISTISPFPTPKFRNLGVTFFTSISAQNWVILQFYQIVEKLFFKLIPGSDFLRTIQQYYKTLQLGFYLRASSS